MDHLSQAAAQVRIRRESIERIAFAKRNRLLHRYERSLFVVGFEISDAVFETVTDCREKRSYRIILWFVHVLFFTSLTTRAIKVVF